MARIIHHRDGRYDLKLRRRIFHGKGMRTDDFGDLRQFLMGDLLAVDAHSLVEAHDIGRDIQARPVSGLFEDRCRHGTYGAFPVGSGDMDKLQFILRISQTSQQITGTRKSGTGSEPANAVDKGKCFLWCHVHPPSLGVVSGLYSASDPSVFRSFCRLLDYTTTSR